MTLSSLFFLEALNRRGNTMNYSDSLNPKENGNQIRSTHLKVFIESGKKKKPVKSGLKKPIKPYSDSTKVHKNETRIFNNWTHYHLVCGRIEKKNGDEKKGPIGRRKRRALSMKAEKAKKNKKKQTKQNKTKQKTKQKRRQPKFSFEWSSFEELGAKPWMERWNQSTSRND